MERVLRQIYADVASGRLSRQEALEQIKAIKLQQKRAGVLVATPVWQTGERTADGELEYAEHHVLPLQAADENVAQRYHEHALACFERIRAILEARPQGKVLVQIVTTDPLFAGLSGLLKTAALENPQFCGQLIVVPPDMTAEERDRCLREEKSRGLDPLVTYERGVREVLRWQEVVGEQDDPPLAFKDDAVYLITGGLGALGSRFAGEIADRTRRARVILTGRSGLTADKQIRLSGLSGASYRQVDLADADAVERLIAGIQAEHGRLDGILHCAGMIADNFILKKTSAEFSEVLAPKVAGTFHLHRASREMELDFFVLFSSLAGAMGNLGQADYATANAFLDQFAAYREREAAAGRCHGRTRSINWTLWQAGGMATDRESVDALLRATGTQPMQTATGMQAFRRSLALPSSQLLVGEGDLARMRSALLAIPVLSSEPQGKRAPVVGIDAHGLAEKTQDFLCRQLAGLLKLPAQAIDPQAALEQYGIDSLLAMKLTSELEQTFGRLPKTLFFEYATIGALTQYFVQSHAARLATLFQAPADATRPEGRPPVPMERTSNRRRAARDRRTASDPIAIIGLSGRYPEAVDIEAYWRNLRDGKDCIVEVPKDRWNWREYYSEDRTRSGHHYSKWGGFIAGVDEFDPLFFNISPKEAKFIDPQERLFLQHAWMAVEDAGYTRASLQAPSESGLPGQVGVYAGLMYSEYQLFGAEASARGKRLGIAGSPASIANRVSYALNLHGPSMTLDTMCSSSLTAIHLACQDLRQGRTSLAIAGGVNVSIHPNKYLVLSTGQFISSDGHCQSFGEGGDGYIPGEGVGVVVLKRLSEAERDGDHIYGIIRGSALNHGGKTNGYTVPSPQAQADAISRALAESHTDARHISYIEAHGTGTKLGDPIEIAALSKAFGPYTGDTQFCLIGSVKSNIGHCESAAGVAGLTKVLLQMQHRQIVPSLHSGQLNPHIEFPSSPFVVNQSLTEWEQPVIDGRTLPRIAGLSSFGAGGSNAHLIIEEYQAPPRQPVTVAQVIVPLSARTPEQLQQKVRDLLDFVGSRLDSIDLASLAYTLQVGREAMDERLSFVVSSVEQLVERLRAHVAGAEAIEDAYQGQAKRNRDVLAMFGTDADLRQTIDKWAADNRLSKLAELWVNGLDLDWNKLYAAGRPQRVSLPTYPFARERHWIDIDAAPAAPASAAAAVLHPLLHSNTSDLSQQSYSSTFSGGEPFIEAGMLPEAAQLEMARVAVEKAAQASGETRVELRDVVWTQPIRIVQPTTVNIALWEQDERQIDFEIYTGDGDEETVHCQGRAVLTEVVEPVRQTPALELVRREIVLAAPARKKRETISLAAPGADVPSGSATPAATRPRTTLSSVRQDSAAAPSVSDVRLYDRGHGIFSIDIAEPRSGEMLSSLRRALERAQQEAQLKVLMLRGLERAFGAVDQHLHHAIVSFPYPVIATLHGDAVGASLMAAALCDFMVCNEDATYGYAGAPTAAEASLLSERFGAVQYTASTGRQLRSRGWTCPFLPPAQIDDYAEKLALDLADKPQDALRLLKAHLTRRLSLIDRPWLQSLAAVSEQTGEPSGSPVAIPLQSTVVTATAHPDGIVVVKMEDREARNMFSDAFIAGVREAFAHIEQSPAYKVVVLTGYDAYFSSGGTKESLLAVQEGKTRFTDVEVFRLPLDCRLPVIAAMQGHGLGAGWAMGLFADLALMSDESRYVSPYMSYGFTPGAGATWALPEQLGPDLARESLFTGRSYTGRELKERGVRLPILPRSEVLAEAMALARRIAQTPRVRLVSLKRQWTESVREAVEETIRLELDMHDKTFVGRPETAERIQLRFQAEAETRPAAAAPAAEHVPATAVMPTLRKLLADELQMREADIDDHTEFVDLGLDSVAGVTWIRKINETYRTSIEATQIYSHPTLAALGRLVQAEAEKQAPATASIAETPVPREIVAKPASQRRRRRAASRAIAETPASTPLQRIAIVGMAGQFPQARNLDQFWQNLAQGRDCITQVARERWDVGAYYQPGDPVPGKTNSQWLGALNDYDRFDPLFFNISPTEAEFMDPQQRLFLEACWHGIENAGYDARALSGSKCGVFVGCAAGDYQQLSRLHSLSAQGFTGNATSILAARISYFLNLQGPCVSIDTACSSSLVAIAQACDSLISGGSDLALAGGVYAMAGPDVHIRSSQTGMLSPEGRCFTFDQRADGFVPGEGVGVVLLKRLEDAEKDRDIIYGVIEGWGVNQDGRTNGITAPNPESQTRLMQEVYDRHAIDPASIRLVEAHGTGTKLGDPVEVEGLRKAFAKYTAKKQYCALGSVKSNIGHCLTAAGIAGVIKLLLALKHRQLPPTINFERLNEHIDLTASPFYVNTRLEEWELDGDATRRAAISSFGFSGTNAHIVIGEHLPPAGARPAMTVMPPDRKLLFPLSAKRPAQLKQKARDLLDFIRKEGPSADLSAIAYTLQVGREPMDERIGFLASSVAELTEGLEAYLEGRENIKGFHHGQVKRDRESLNVITQDDDVKASVVAKWLAHNKLSGLLDLWTKGLDLDWNDLYGEAKPRRVALPGYPFARERYWIDAPAESAAVVAPRQIVDDGKSYLWNWEEEPQPQQRPPVDHETPVIVLCGPFSELETTILEHYRQRGREPLLIRPGDVTDPEGFRKCLQAAGGIDAVYFLATGDEIQFLRLIKTLQQNGSDAAIDLYILTMDEMGAGVTGLGYSVAQGIPRYRVRNLDLSAKDLQSEQDRQTAFAAVLAEPSSKRGEVYRLRAGRRYRRTFFKVKWDTNSPPALRRNGAYVIAGGAGRLGRIITRNLIERYDATVVWIGRSAESSDQVQRSLRSLDGLGASPLYIQADVTDLDALREAVRLMKERGIEPSGAIFAAMAIGTDNSIEEITEDEFRRGFDIKAWGSRAFYTALQDEPLDFLCYFSSRQAYAFVGASKYAAYGSGVAFADAFVRSLQNSSRFPVGTINWGAWTSTLDEAAQGAMADIADAVGDEEGFEVFERFVTELQRRRVHQCLCAGESLLLDAVMHCSPDEVIALTRAPLSPAPEIDVEVPRERIASLRSARAKWDELEGWFLQLLYCQVQPLMQSTGGIIDKYARWWSESLDVLRRNGYFEGMAAADASAIRDAWPAQRERYARDSDFGAIARLASDCLEKLPDVLQGRILATDVIFPGSSMEKIEGIYKGSPLPDTFNEIAANAVVACVRERLRSDPNARLRILEIGAGTGSTSTVVFPKLRPYQASIEEYCYTDLSKAFFFRVEEKWVPEYPYIRCRRLDIEQSIEEQGLEVGGFDVVLASNVLHATRNIRRTVRNAKALLRSGGALVLEEISSKTLYALVAFGLLDGWWLYEDPELRIPSCPGLFPSTWQRLLEEEGFAPVQFPAGEAHDLGYQIVLARSDGAIRQKRVVAVQPAAMEAREEPRRAAPAVFPAPNAQEHVRTTILECMSEVLRIPAEEIDADIAFSDYGIDSILGGKFVAQVNDRLGIRLNTAVVFEYPSLARLSQHVLEAHRDQVQAAAAPVVVHPRLTVRAQAPVEAKVEAGSGEIAVIGMSGMFPKAENVDQFWRNLVDGVDGVEELPAHYLDQSAAYSARKQPGKTRCKWGGILRERDCFDPLFFNLSPKEAESMNPHQRLILQEGWKAIEDAGYNPKALSGSQTGIFIGAEPTGYMGETFTGYSDAIVASRLSYVLNLSGPAFVVNTGCSSSAVAIHLACESLRNRETDLAVAGGVHACMRQKAQVSLDQIDMLSPSGRSRTFDSAADGTIISEGVAVVVLKRLEDAVRMGDPIYGVIAASGINQDGASNGITAPSGAAQEQLILKVYEKFGIDPARISYVEAHGTGTKLGDPVEGNALVRAFRRFTEKTGYCAVGSAKSHVGHTGAAAGITGLVKILLSLQHGRIPRALHFNTLNPLIEFNDSPFYISVEESEWKSRDGSPRMAALNAFGHSGTNAHLVIREYVEPAEAHRTGDLRHSGDPVIVPLSAKTNEQLRQKAVDLLAFIRRPEVLDLRSLGYTLQTGREAMEERVGFIVGSVAQLAGKLQAYLDGAEDIDGVRQGRVKRQKDALALLIADGGLEETIDQWIHAGRLSKLLELWVQGVALDWRKFYGGAEPRRMRLPVYPFAKERYWALDTVSLARPQEATLSANFESVEDVLERIEQGLMGEREGAAAVRLLIS